MFSSPKAQTSTGVHPATQSMGSESYFPVVKWIRYKANLSPPTCAKIKNVWSYTAPPPSRGK
jgi:hypothetical protein